VRLDVATGYPFNGRIRVRIDSTPDRPWSLTLRVPAWAAGGARLTVAGRARPVSAGPVTERRVWQRGDEVVLELPMAPRFTHPDPRIDAVRGCVAVEQGPLVLAVESVDVPSVATVDELRVDVARPPRLVDGRVVVDGRRAVGADAEAEADWPYQAATAPGRGEPMELPLVPYYRWANRGPSTMRVWLPVDDA